MNNDSTVTPAPFEKITSLFHATGVKSLVQKCPRELLLSMQLKGTSSVDADVLEAKVRVWLNVFISPTRENSSPWLADASLYWMLSPEGTALLLTPTVATLDPVTPGDCSRSVDIALATNIVPHQAKMSPTGQAEILIHS